MNNLSYDIIIVGAGIAGWVAGLRAVEQGGQVLIIDKTPGELGSGNSLMTSGSYRAGGMDARTAPAELYRQVMKEGTAFPDLAKAWAENCSRSVDWLKALGLEMVDTPTGTIALEPYSSISLAPVYKKDVGTNILKKLKNEFLKRGGKYAAGVEARRLVVSQEDMTGLVAQKDGQTLSIESKATILATGGFSANKEMLVRYIGKHADQCKLRGSASETGDGLRMALEVGAKAVNLNYFYGHLISLKAVTDDRFWPYPRLDSFVAEGILVNRSGNRFVDEGRGDVAVTNEVAKSDDVLGSCLIFDEKAWDGAKGDPRAALPRTPAPNPWLMENDGFLFKASSPSELGKQLGIDGVSIAETLERFNLACESGSLETEMVRRTGKARVLKSPYYGLKVMPGITFTMGGALINGRAEVLNLDEKPIRGLYAAGDAIGGLMGGFNGGYTGGLTQAVVTGMLAGDNATNLVKRI